MDPGPGPVQRFFLAPPISVGSQGLTSVIGPAARAGNGAGSGLSAVRGGAAGVLPVRHRWGPGQDAPALPPGGDPSAAPAVWAAKASADTARTSADARVLPWIARGAQLTAATARAAPWCRGAAARCQGPGSKGGRRRVGRLARGRSRPAERVRRHSQAGQHHYQRGPQAWARHFMAGLSVGRPHAVNNVSSTGLMHETALAGPARAVSVK